MQPGFKRLNDAQWSTVAGALRSAGGNLSRDTRDHVDGIMYLMQFDLPWRDMPTEFGKWNSVYRRFIRWAETGILDVLSQVLRELCLTSRWNTNWIAQSRSTGARSAPTIRELVARHIVDGQAGDDGETVTSKVRNVTKFNHQKTKKPRKSRAKSIAAREEPAQGFTKAIVTAMPVKASQRNTSPVPVVAAIRARRERRRRMNKG